MGLVRCLAAAFLLLLLPDPLPFSVCSPRVAYTPANTACADCLLAGLSTGQRVVTVQKGPLYRVRGSHVTLWCKVSGYQGPAEQNFQWSIYLPSAPEREVQIVSTVDPSFPYAIYTQRVRSRGIYVERVQGDAVLLHITELQDRDAGEYECHTPNTDERYFGSYSAKMNLSVIADTLSASMVPQVLTPAEGDVVELACEVSKSTAQHTHLSVGWYHLQGAGESRAEEVLTLSKDFVLRPGPSYMQRFLAGDVRLNKVGNTTYKLFIGGAKLSDRGQLYCEAAEWIEDPDETWKDISRKETGRTSLVVMSQGRDLSVDIAAAETSLSEGDTLQLNCMVGAQKSSSRHFQVLWLLNGVGVARVDPRGVLIWEEEYEERAKLGQLRAFKQSNMVYVLTVYEVGLKDNGTYHCSVSEVKTPGDFHAIQTNLSSGIQVDVKPIESRMRLSVSTSTPQVMAGDALILLCKVQGVTSPVSVQWWHLPPRHPGPRVPVATMEQDGTLSLGSTYRDGGTRGSLRLEKASSGTFTLVIPNTLDEGDGGRYGCEATEWSRGQSWTEEGETAVTVSSMGELGHPYFWAFKLDMLEARLEKRVDTCLGLHATLRSRIATVTYGQSFELVCQVSASYTLEEVPMSVAWLFQTSPPTGHYHELPVTTARSNAVGIKVVLPESRLQVSTKESSVEIAGGADTAIECRIVFAQNNSQFSITWYLLPPSPANATPLKIVRLNYSSILEYGAEFSSPAQKSRFLSQRVSSNVFWLRILSANPRDQGRYYCVVEEWRWLGDSWYKLGEGASGRTTLEFKLPERELHLEKTNSSVLAREGEEVTLHCLLRGARPPAACLSATWFRGEESGRPRPLLTLHRDGAIEYPRESQDTSLVLQRHSCSGDFALFSYGRVNAASVYMDGAQSFRESTVFSRICSSPPLLNFILYLPLVLILLLALAGFCWYFRLRKSKKGDVTGDQLMELHGAEEVKQT
ncbi:PREDICTED: immunoglobulin superfamily member 2 [Fulmarus glacialis]|uniref:immunoglobulin superfamily member 2 n=1 Tax=Fulmarus glacialis TaxID=30455 RepID=UPI00051C9CA1|nr:PREDICTED: immunoglobulin superfamily member 2 [Fulmarus glacialis]